jgi:hypothetical protein
MRKKPKTELDDESEEEMPLKHHVHFEENNYGQIPVLDGSDLEVN